MIADTIITQTSDKMRLISLLETAEPFDDWVRAHDRNAEIGTRCSTAACPLSQFIKDTLGFYAVMVSDIEVRVWATGPTLSTQGSSFTLDLPIWAQFFIEELDGTDTMRPGVDFMDAMVALEAVYRKVRYNNA